MARLQFLSDYDVLLLIFFSFLVRKILMCKVVFFQILNSRKEFCLHKLEAFSIHEYWTVKVLECLPLLENWTIKVLWSPNLIRSLSVIFQLKLDAPWSSYFARFCNSSTVAGYDEISCSDDKIVLVNLLTHSWYCGRVLHTNKDISYSYNPLTGWWEVSRCFPCRMSGGHYRPSHWWTIHHSVLHSVTWYLSSSK